MEFSPFNPTVKIYLQGMEMEEKGQTEGAYRLFLQSWEEATTDFEKFLAAHYLSRHQKNASDKLHWLNTALALALKIDDDSVKSALPFLHHHIAKCYETLNDQEKAREHEELSRSYQYNPSDKGPFYHGTKADLQIGDLLIPGGNSNYKAELKMKDIYFTALPNGAGLAAALAQGDGQEHVYIVEPTGPFENDPNLTDKKFPGNPSRSYRSEAPLKIIGEIKEWVRPPAEDLQKFREKLANNKGEIIN